jgi:HD superfamily phosphohydrolase
VTDAELGVIDTPAFQRLHHVRQLGLNYLVYPTAQHTRFSHSLGVLHVVSEFIDALRSGAIDSTSLEDEDVVQELRLAALLHDIGHHPFSHVLENEMESYDGNEANHTNLAKWIIENTSIKDHIGDYNLEHIHAIITRTHTDRICNSLVSSDLDADRLDYLLRDAYFTGVAYGAVDIHRILGIAQIREDNVVYDVKGLPTIESYLMARMSMYRAVYHHKTSTGFGLLLRRVYRKLRDEGTIYTLEQIKSLNEFSLHAYNDDYLFSKIRMRTKMDDDVAKMGEFIIHRKPLKLADIVYSYQIESNGYTHLAPLKYDKPSLSVAEDARISPEWIFYERVASKFVDLEESPIMIYDENESHPIPITKYRKSAITDFIDKTYFEDRVYTQPGRENDLKKAIRERYGP